MDHAASARPEALAQLEHTRAEHIRRGGPPRSHRWTSPLRVLPDFLIIGAMRCGTTTLYYHLIQHPSVATALRKEIHFFDRHHARGTNWYRAHFPTMLARSWARHVRREPWLTVEATPAYLFHPHAPQRAAALIPHAKLIAVLRDPVDRAYSHYWHEVRNQRETASFAEAIDLESQRLHGEQEKLRQNPHYQSDSRNHYSYLTRGIYVDQLQLWERSFSRDRLLVLRSEDLNAAPARTLRQAFEFLGLPDCSLPHIRAFNKADCPEMPAGLRDRLVDFFRPHNARLREFLKFDLNWDS